MQQEKISKNFSASQEALGKTWQAIKLALPIVVGISLLISFLNPILEKYYPKIFTGNYFLDPLIGALAGSASFGIPVVSYVTGGELLKEGVSLLAVTAFILSWSSVGLVMLPLEIANLGRRFALLRNSLNFINSIILAILTILTLNLIR
jgi:hypothetical protein